MVEAESAWQAAAATALLSDIGLGEATYGLTMVADTTSPVYWTLIGLLALGLLVAMLIRRFPPALTRRFDVDAILLNIARGSGA